MCVRALKWKFTLSWQFFRVIDPDESVQFAANIRMYDKEALEALRLSQLSTSKVEAAVSN